MLLLALDTAGPDCSVALARADAGTAAILARRSERIVRGHAERLMPMVDEVLAEAGAAYFDLSRIVVTTGPGSFTGVRVGVAAARALALRWTSRRWGRRAGGACRPLHSLGQQEPSPLRSMRSAANFTSSARRAGKPGGRAAAMSVEAAAALSELAEPIVVTGSAAAFLRDALAGIDAQVAGTAESPDIAEVARSASAPRRARRPPLYLRGADAKPQADKAVARL
jgi:tRNA threonylcarbamoyl adenosine modification protein YeaZ